MHESLAGRRARARRLLRPSEVRCSLEGARDVGCSDSVREGRSVTERGDGAEKPRRLEEVFQFFGEVCHSLPGKRKPIDHRASEAMRFGAMRFLCFA